MTTNWEKRISENQKQFISFLFERASSFYRIHSLCIILFKFDKIKKNALSILVESCINNNENGPLIDMVNEIIRISDFIQRETETEILTPHFDKAREKNTEFEEKLSVFQGAIATISDNIFTEENDNLRKSQTFCWFFFELDDVKKKILKKLIEESIKKGDLSYLSELIDSLFKAISFLKEMALMNEDINDKIKDIFNDDNILMLIERKRQILNAIQFLADKNCLLNKIPFFYYGGPGAIVLPQKGLPEEEVGIIDNDEKNQDDDDKRKCKKGNQTFV